jgi:hemolysin activation/secretion protein
MKCRFPSTLAASLLSMAASGACAQGAADALREAGAPPASVPQAPAAPLQRPPAAAPAVPSIAEVTLKEVRFPATEAVSGADLQALAAPWIGRRFGQAELNNLAQAVQALYEQRGYGLAGVAFPTQDLSSGVLQVAIVEPRLGRASVVAGAQPPVSEARVRALLAHLRVQPGRPLNLKALDRAMFALNDLPGVGAKGHLTPTGDEGVFDLAIELEAKKALQASVEANNHGSSTTGTARVGLLARWSNPLRIGDNLDLRLMSSRDAGVALGRLSYEMPLGPTPWRAAVGISRVSYALGGSFEPLEANGVATVRDAAVSYPLLRSRERNLIVRAAYEDKRLEDRFDAFDLRTDKAIRNGVLSAALESQDALGGGGFIGAGVQLQWGRLRIATEDVRLADAALGEQATQGHFEKWTLQLSRLQAITPRLSLFAGLSAQWASRNLDSAEKLTLGGPHAVRAYPAAEAPSDEGLVLNTELRWFVSPRWTVFALHDWGRGEARRRPSPGEPNVRVLRGSGLGLSFSDPNWFTLSATLAWRGNEVPLAAAGSNDRPRLYLQLQKPF